MNTCSYSQPPRLSYIYKYIMLGTDAHNCQSSVVCMVMVITSYNILYPNRIEHIVRACAAPQHVWCVRASRLFISRCWLKIKTGVARSLSFVIFSSNLENKCFVTNRRRRISRNLRDIHFRSFNRTTLKSSCREEYNRN